MAAHNCSMCEEREGELLVSLTSSGDTVYLCAWCLPPWVQAYWAAADLPPLVFDVDDQAVAEAPPAEGEQFPDDPPEPAPVPARPGPKKKPPAKAALAEALASADD